MKPHVLPAIISCCLLLLASTAPSRAQPVTAQPANVISDPQPTGGFAEDPSAVPAFIEDTPAERYRVQVDLNQDGKMDMLLSEPTPLFSNAGGFFSVWIAEDGGYREIGHVFAHPLRIALEHGDRYSGGHKIWWYFRRNSSSGSLGYNAILDDKLRESQYIEIFLSPDDSTVGDRLYKAIFAEPFLLRSEVSTTVGNTVIWEPLRR